eukprot:TRINITY_DN2956_c0_g1_i1.p1 TRINITY_DN2956_c0_g1~~TRINITY_DN2956_c0_g1_i1.p1  ORF type:complete len:288 (+),score=68.34 TRINITY_DN2956_c0_g1_i1:176-1039(+)
MELDEKGLADLNDKIYAYCALQDNGAVTSEIEGHFSKYGTQKQVAEAINSLLTKGRISLTQSGGALRCIATKEEEVAKFKGLTAQERLVYQLIQAEGNMGICTKDVRIRSSLQQHHLTKILKGLENRQLIKHVKGIASKIKRVYMLWDLEPSRVITGGAWYNEQEFDSEFIRELNQICYLRIAQQGQASSQELIKFVMEAGVSKVELRLEDLQMIVDTLMYDGRIEVVQSTTLGSKGVYYKPSNLDNHTNAYTEVPCSVCPVFDQCSDDGVISPSTCIYYQEWLSPT